MLTAALREAVPYVGLIASPRRGEAVRASLDLPADLRAQLRTPAGLDIGAATPEEIALSILAEIVSTRRPGRPSGPESEIATDPVCGMDVAISPASIQLELDGDRHYFCGEGCRDRFAAEHAPDASAR